VVPPMPRTLPSTPAPFTTEEAMLKADTARVVAAMKSFMVMDNLKSFRKERCN
jgi:hypothetical protein